jgi:DNA-binding response OmpR family regulator
MTRVLVADDNREFAELLRTTLEDAGYEVVTAYSGIAAVTAAESADLDAAILDVLLPGLSGDAIAERLRQVRPKLPILLMTGSGDQFARGSGLPVLRKPFPEAELLTRVAQLTGSRTRD